MPRVGLLRKIEGYAPLITPPNRSALLLATSLSEVERAHSRNEGLHADVHETLLGPANFCANDGAQVLQRRHQILANTS